MAIAADIRGSIVLDHEVIVACGKVDLGDEREVLALS